MIKALFLQLLYAFTSLFEKFDNIRDSSAPNSVKLTFIIQVLRPLKAQSWIVQDDIIFKLFVDYSFGLMNMLCLLDKSQVI